MPIYEEKEKINGQKRYYIRTYVTNEKGQKKQITRHNKNWIGRDGYWSALQEETKLKNEHKFKNRQIDISLKDLKEKYLLYLKNKVDKDTLKAKEIKLDHFCEIDQTKQVTTYPTEKINFFNKEIYLKWQLEMKNKKYKKNKYSNKEFYFTIKYLNSIHNEICNMIDFGITEGFCNKNFAKQVGRIGTPKEVKMSISDRYYTVITFKEYLDLLNVSQNNLKYNTYFDLSFSRGPRPGEIRAFRIKDYNPDKKQLMVNHTMSKHNELKEPKTSSSKAPIDLDDNVNLKIINLINKLRENPDCNDNWYIFGGATPISSHSLDNAKNKYFKLANITFKENETFRLHDFRHSCATWLYSINVPITVISKILRHANIQETMKTYTHLFKKDYKENLDIINNYKYNAKQDQKQDQLIK